MITLVLPLVLQLGIAYPAFSGYIIGCSVRLSTVVPYYGATVNFFFLAVFDFFFFVRLGAEYF